MPTPSRADNAVRHATVQRSSYSKAEWCAAHNISPSFYDKMKREGWGPREMDVGGKKINISAEADAEWKKEREKAAKKQQEASA